LLNHRTASNQLWPTHIVTAGKLAMGLSTNHTQMTQVSEQQDQGEQSYLNYAIRHRQFIALSTYNNF